MSLLETQFEVENCVDTNAFFGTMDDINDPIEERESLHNVSGQTSFDKCFNFELGQKLYEHPYYIWNEVPDLYQNWRRDQNTKSNNELLNPKKVSFLDSNLVSVGHIECMIYNKLFWEETSRCLSCFNLGILCNADHGWCRCERANHMILVKNPFDVKRLRTVRKVLTHVKLQQQMIKKQAPTIFTKSNERICKNEPNAIAMKYKLSEGYCNKNQPNGNAAVSSHCLLQKNLQDMPSHNTKSYISQLYHNSQSNSEFDKEDSSRGKLPSQRYNQPISKSNKTSNFTQVQQATTKGNVLQNQNEASEKCLVEGVLARSNVPQNTSLPGKNLSIASIKAASDKETKGTPDRLEETRRLRAKIREEQLLRLKPTKMNGGWSKDKLPKKDTMFKYTNNETNNLSHTSLTWQASGSQKIKTDKKEAAYQKSESTVKRKNSMSLPTVLTKSYPSSSNARLTDLKLIESKLRKENDKTSMRILSSPVRPQRPLSSKMKYASSTNVFDVKNPTDTLRTSVSMFQDFTPVKR